MRIDKNYFESLSGMMFLKHSAKIKIIKIVRNTMNDLKLQQPELFENGLSEDTLKYQYAILFEQNFEEIMNITNDYIDYRVDINYNRTGNDMKFVGVCIGDNGRTLFDLVIHQRGIGNRSYPENLIHFEIKGFSDNQAAIRADKERIMFTTMGNNDPLIVPNGYIQLDYYKYIRGYQLGLFLHFSRIGEDNLLAFSNGKKLFISSSQGRLQNDF